MAIPAYRSLFRAARLAFEGDERMLTAARSQIRAGFREKAALAPTDPTLPLAVRHAELVAGFLRSNVVQGKREGDGETYSTYIQGWATAYVYVWEGVLTWGPGFCRAEDT